MPSTRERALEAAVDLLGTEGLRALTHARVDERAELPRGSTSNWFRTRAALLGGVAEWIAHREMPGVDQATGLPTTVDEFLELLCATVEHNTRAGRTLTAARLVLFVEASHDPALQAVLDRGRAAMETAATGVLMRLGAPDPAAGASALMGCAEGLILHRIARNDYRDLRPPLELVMRGVLGQGIAT